MISQKLIYWGLKGGYSLFWYFTRQGSRGRTWKSRLTWKKISILIWNYLGKLGSCLPLQIGYILKIIIINPKIETTSCKGNHPTSFHASHTSSDDFDKWCCRLFVEKCSYNLLASWYFEQIYNRLILLTHSIQTLSCQHDEIIYSIHDYENQLITSGCVSSNCSCVSAL